MTRDDFERGKEIGAQIVFVAFCLAAAGGMYVWRTLRRPLWPPLGERRQA